MRRQAQHEIKRRERDYERLQGRLRDLLVEKSREQKVALEAVGRFRDTARVRAKKSDEAMYQVSFAASGIGKGSRSTGAAQGSFPMTSREKGRIT